MNKLFISFCLFSFTTAIAQPRASVAFKIAEKDLIPEGIAWDPASGNFFLGSIHKKKIVRIAKGGRVSDFATEGLLEVLGMKVHNGKLWVCHNSPAHDSTAFISMVSVYTIADGRRESAYTLKDGTKHLFNDIVITAAGIAYVTDSDGGAVYRLVPGTTEFEAVVTPGKLRYPNGICLSPDESKAIVSTGSASGIIAVDLTTGSITPLQSDRYLLIGADGLYRYKNKLIAVQNVTFPEAVLQFQVDAGFTRVEEVIALVSSIKEFDVPTTGVVVGDDFYFIANSQLLQVVNSAGSISEPSKLKETIVMRIPLR